jgi:hypothetical protein
MSENQSLLLQLQQLLNWKKSKKFYAEKLGISEYEVNELLKELREKDNDDEVPIRNYTEERKVNVEKGTIESTIVSDFDPKDDIELAKLHKINLDKYIITNYWSKMLPSGKFTSSVFSKLISIEEKNKEKLIEQLKIFFNNNYSITQHTLPDKISDKAMFVYIADDHAGIDFKESLFNNPYTGEIYYERLNKLADKVIFNSQGAETLYIVNLGDELDGFNKQTTRGGHALDSLSNKEQFDIYIKARRNFYDKILLENTYKQVTIININNSNHTGNDYSYIVNKALEFYLLGQFPKVNFINQEKFIDSYTWGDHTILLTHGKDEKYMKFGFPLNLNEKIDLWLLDYSKNLKTKYVSTVKGDLHAYSVNIGKSGRYINVPSICGGSNWIEHNYGSSNAGALLEIVDKEDKNITSIPIWF